jgi:hypothetical protein
MGGGEHGVRGRFTRTREGLRRVAGRVRSDQGRGVLLHPQLALRLKVSGHGEARRRGSVDHGGGILREGKGGQGSTWATRDRYACTLGCAATRVLGWRRVSSSMDANAFGSARSTGSTTGNVRQTRRH